MKKETYEAQKAFAGEKKPSMLRRCVGHDYSGRQMYMITMVTEGRRPLFGRVVGRSDAMTGSSEAPRLELSPLGRLVKEEWWATSAHHPEVEVVALQMMPDHLHGVLFVKEQMEHPLGIALRGFKQKCNQHYRALLAGQQSGAVEGAAAGTAGAVPFVALSTQHTEPQATPIAPQTRRSRRGEERKHGLLFARGYNDKLLLRDGQLDAWLHYLEDNPRRLLMKREHPDLFRVQRNVTAAGLTFSAIGNRFLLERPVLVQVQCSRRLTEAEIAATVQHFLTQARGGAVLVSPSISSGEKAVMRAAFDAGLPLIFLEENGFTDLAKPGGRRMEACARGQLLILAPWEHHNEKTTIARHQCLALNDIARQLATDRIGSLRHPGTG